MRCRIGAAAGRLRRIACAVALVLAVVILNTLLDSGCASHGENAGPQSASTGPVRYIVKAEQTPFYKYGPAQANGPDFQLKKGRIVIMLERQYGFSRVQTDEGDSGYVGTDDIAPAPDQNADLADAAPKHSGDGATRSHGGNRTPVFDQPNDAPLPSGQPPSDEPMPSFRY